MNDVTDSTRSRATPLERALAGSTNASPGPLDALAAARRRFLSGQRVEISAIANDLGVSRVTLHRWVGSRAALLGEVMAQLATDTIERDWAGQAVQGGPRLAAVASGLVQSLMSHDGMRALLDAEPEFALRTLTTRETTVQRTIVDAWTRLIERESRESDYVPPMAPRDLAYLLVRLSESFVYREVIAGEPADPADAATVFGLLLR